MRRRLAAAAGVVVFALMISGCGETGNAGFARKVVDAAYAGSFGPLRDSMTELMQENMTDSVVGPLGKGLQQQYGEVKGLKLASSEKLNEGMDDEYVHETWNVRSERGTFRMQLFVDKKGRLAGVWFEPR